MYQSTRDERKHGVQDPHTMAPVSSGEEDASSGEGLNVGGKLQAILACMMTARGKSGYRHVRSQNINVTRTGICRRTVLVVESILFSKEVIQKGSVFWGFVLLPG